MRISKIFMPAAALALVATTAHAHIVTATYSGVVANGYDTTGVFGAANTDLTGAAFTAVYKVDSSVNSLTFNSPGSMSYRIGGTNYGFSSSPVSAVVTIHGVSAAFGGLQTGEAYRSKVASGGNELFHETYSASTVKGVSTQQFVETFVYSKSNGPVFAGPRSGGFLQDVVVDTSTGAYSTLVQGVLTPTSLTIGVVQPQGPSVASVPEPATWALMLLGFGGLGAAMRSRRRAALTA